MSKILLKKLDIGGNELIQGALIGAGAGLMIRGFLKFIEARKIRLKAEEPVDEEAEFEEYKRKKARKVLKKRKKKVTSGIMSLITGSLTIVTGIIFFSPSLRESEVVGRIKDTDVLDKIREAELIDKLKDSDLIDKLKDSDLIDRIKEADAAGRIKDIDVLDKVKDIARISVISKVIK